jgi:predicted esterase
MKRGAQPPPRSSPVARLRVVMVCVLIALATRVACAAEAASPGSGTADPVALSAQAQQDADAHDYRGAIALMHQALAVSDRVELHYNLACYLALSGERDQALAELGTTIDKGFADADQLRSDTDLVSLRTDARFAGLVERARRLNQERAAKLAATPPAKTIFELPTPAADGATFPLVIALHGVGGNPEQMATPLRAWARKSGFALLAVSGSHPTNERGDGFGWAVPADVDRVHRILGEVEEQQPIDRSRVYVVGFSQGGVMSFPIAFRDPGRFAGVIVMSGALQPETVREDLIAAAAPKLPVFLTHGEQDPIVVYAKGKETQERLRAAHFAVELYSFTGAHRFPPDHEQVLTRAIAWIDEQRAARK